MTHPLPLDKQFPGFKAVIMGPSGTGKTFSLSTLTEASVAGSPAEIFYLDLDRSLETLVGVFVDAKPRGRGMIEPPPNLHWHYMHRKSIGFDTLIKTAEWVSKLDLSALAKMKDNDRSANNQFITLLEVFNGFTDQRTGKNYGPVDTWGNDRVLVVDALTSVNDIVFDMVVGTRAMRDKPDYGIAQNLLQNLLHRLTMGCVCNFVLTAHVERQVDEVLGGTKIMPVTIGQALKPVLPIPFSDVILTVRNGDKWLWDTANGQADLKTRNLAYSSNLPADFRPLVATWDKRREVYEANERAKLQAEASNV